MSHSAVSKFHAHRVFALVLGVAMAASPALAGGQQEQRPRFETTVEIVQMQVAVADSLGYPISGLGREDFRLQIEGDPRDVVAVYEVDLRRDDPDMDDDDSFVGIDKDVIPLANSIVKAVNPAHRGYPESFKQDRRMGE